MSILDFWKAHPNYWITINNKETVDKEIYEKFYGKFPNDKDHEYGNWISQVIYLDQFSRHFLRYLESKDLSFGLFTEDTVYENRIKAVKIVQLHLHLLKYVDEVELVFCLMPFKHLELYDFIFELIHKVWLKSEYRRDKKKIKEYPLLSKFYNDTYSKAFSYENIKRDVSIIHNPGSFNYDKVCEFYSEDYKKTLKKSFNIDDKIEKELNIDSPIISLSGGVDSMVLVYCLRMLGKFPNAVHIIYGNREDSEEEFRFISDFCKNIGVPLYSYKIKWLKRNEVDRDFYEEMTKKIRFNVYRAVGGKNCNIVLGHIKDDIIENVWTNIARCKHLDNLKKMEKVSNQNDVNIFRPFLDVCKKNIIDVAHSVGIPYLKNTTPSWSNRGKFRENFYTSVLQQFGKEVDNSIIKFSEMIQEQTSLIDRLLYYPILKTFERSREVSYLNITKAIEGKIGLSEWNILFEKLFHQKLKMNKPSMHSVKNFYERVKKDFYEFSHNKNKKENKIEIQVKIKKDLTFFIHYFKENFYLKIKNDNE